MKRKFISFGKAMKIYARDKFTCQRCGKVGEFIFRYGNPRVVENPEKIIFTRTYYNGPGVIPFEIDHKTPICLGGDNSIDNLQLLCRRCNRSKGSKHG